MAQQQKPGWTTSPTEWAVLRDQLTTSSNPSLSSSTKISSYFLVTICSFSVLLHSCAVWLRFKKSNPSSSFPFGSKSLGYHQPNLSFILPIIFLLNAIFDLLSISSLLSDANRSKFAGYTLAIQHFSYSLLLSAGVLTTWALACGLPPMHIGGCRPTINRVRRSNNTSIHTNRTMRPSQLNFVGYSGVLALFFIPLPCIILLKKSVDDMNNLDDTLLVMVNQILEITNQPADRLINQALTVINKLDQTSNFLFFHIRMLSAIHLTFNFIILSSSFLISISIIRAIVREFGSNSKKLNSFNHRWQKNDCDRMDQNTLTEPNPIDHSITEPKPALINDLSKIFKEQPSIELQVEIDEYDCKNPLQKPSNQTNQNPNMSYTPSSITPAYHFNSANTVDQDQSKKLKKYVKKIKQILLLVSIPCLSFIVLNFCIVTNLFKYPDEISIGDLLILKLEWSTWLWNGSISPLIGIINCFILLTKNPTRKWPIAFSIF